MDSGTMNNSGMVISSARGGRRVPAEPLEVSILRSLGPEDLPMLVNPPVLARPQMLKELRYSHHRLAELLAAGTERADAALITGYSVATVHRLATADPAFTELVKHYQTTRELRFVEVIERMKTLGLTTLEEIQARLEEAPEKFSARELMELAELTLIKGRQGVGGPAGGGLPSAGTGATGGVTVNVSFVGARQPQIEGELAK